jgi:hypothetical protein
MSTLSRWVIRPQTPEEVYTDRQEFIEYFVTLALEAIRRRTMSTVLLNILSQEILGHGVLFGRFMSRPNWKK